MNLYNAKPCIPSLTPPSALINSNINCLNNVFTSHVITGATSLFNYIPTSSTSIVSEFLEQHTDVTKRDYNFQNQTTFENYKNNLLEEEKKRKLIWKGLHGFFFIWLAPLITYLDRYMIGWVVFIQVTCGIMVGFY